MPVLADTYGNFKVDKLSSLHKNEVDVLHNLHERASSMSLPHPSHYHAALTTERLALVSRLLLTELAATERLMSSEVDDGYTRGCPTFGRQKNRIKLEARSGRTEWLTIVNPNNDLVFAIGGIPCRFSNDNPDSPSKDAVTVANRHQASFFEDFERGVPKRFCFVVDRGATEHEDARVVFLGYDENNVLRCRWTSDSVRTLQVVEPTVPAAAHLPKPIVGPKRSDSGDVGSTGT